VLVGDGGGLAEGRAEGTGDGEAGLVGPRYRAAVAVGGVVAEGFGAPVSEQASERNSKRGNSNFFTRTS